jgi:hypothetical protein
MIGAETAPYAFKLRAGTPCPYTDESRVCPYGITYRKIIDLMESEDRSKPVIGKFA